ncbi:MAG: type I 3-dehydroquinate dehydratase [Clostridiales bacterium]|nr:type I 3-dehydroquinate dehydratase [Clostridiales bacterium]
MSFLNAKEPFITEMVQVPTIDLAKGKITTAINGGATAIGLQLSYLEKTERTEKNLRSIFESVKDKPVYVTNYRGEKNVGIDDQALMEELLLALNCGATLIDVMGDLYDPSPEELTTDKKAIEKQIALIDKIHQAGGEVLMSSHIKEYRSPERVLEVALAQQSRGADVVKIVTGAQTVEQEISNLEICNLLKKELKVPFLFLSSGSHTRLHRTIGPALGVCMWLCFSKYDEYSYSGPPLLEDVVKIKQGLKL